MIDGQRDDTSVFHGDGNVFADMGLPNPEERLLKARLASLILDVMEERSWTQKDTAKVLGIKQPDVSNITRGRLKDISVERLMNFLARLGRRVAITVSDGDLPAQEFVIVPLANASSERPRQVAEAEARS